MLKNSHGNAIKKESSVQWSEMGMIIAFIVMFIFFSVSTRAFFSLDNLTTILKQVSIVGICAVGMTVVMLTGGIDLSSSGLIGVGAVMGAYLMTHGFPIWASMLTALLFGIIIGVANAFSVAILSIPPMIATLGMQFILRGSVYIVTGGVPIYNIPAEFKIWGQGSIGIFPVCVLIMAFTYLVGYILLHKTTFGRRLYGVGGNPEAARLSGVNVKNVLFKAYAFSGFMGALAGLIMLSRVNSGQPLAGNTYEMDIITATVLGGVSMFGGQGKILRVIVGVIFIGVLANGMMMLNLNEYMQRVVKGIVLLVSVAFDMRARGKLTA